MEPLECLPYLVLLCETLIHYKWTTCSREEEGRLSTPLGERGGERERARARARVRARARKRALLQGRQMTDWSIYDWNIRKLLFAFRLYSLHVHNNYTQSPMVHVYHTSNMASLTDVTARCPSQESWDGTKARSVKYRK
jgi:hypothetical protein